MIWNLQEIIEATGATPAALPSPSPFITGISTDTRTLREGDLFIALKGKNFDGHRFIQEAVTKRAAAILAEHPDPIVGEIPQLFVPDTLRAYGAIAKTYRKKLKTRITAITGSMGKTTVKDMTHAILSKKFRTVKTSQNENNRVGVPKTILGIPFDAEEAVIEMGSNLPGEIALLTDIVQPDRALITNIAPVHLERFISIDGVRVEKSSLFWRSPEATLRFTNLDDAYIRHIPRRETWPLFTFSTEKNADVTAREITPMGLKGIRFNLSTALGKIAISLPRIGFHQVKNAVAATAIGISAGIPPTQIREALETLPGTKGRLEPLQISPACTILDDTYNANPVAMATALRTLSLFHASHTTIALLGDMLELGKDAEKYHWELGQECAKQRIHLLGLTGDYREAVRRGALEGGMDKPSVFTFETDEELLRHLLPLLSRPVIILVKGSFALHMDRWIQVILSATRPMGGSV